MNSKEQEIYELFQLLDGVQRKAAMTAVDAMIAGAGFLQATASANVILIAAGYEPLRPAAAQMWDDGFMDSEEEL